MYVVSNLAVANHSRRPMQLCVHKSRRPSELVTGVLPRAPMQCLTGKLKLGFRVQEIITDLRYPESQLEIEVL